MASLGREERQLLESAIRAREKEARALEQRVEAQDEALQNLNRLLDAQDRVLQSITTMQNLFAAGGTPREVIAPLLDLAIRATRCEGGVMAIRNPGQSHLAVVAAVGDRADGIRGQLFGEREGIVGEVAASGEPLLVPDARREPRLRADGPDKAVREARNALCVPISGAGLAWGAILLVNTQDRKRFAKQDVDLLVMFAVRLARELDREAEAARVREETARLSTLLRVTELIHVASDRQKIHDLLVQLSARLARAQGAAVWLLDEAQQALTLAVSSEPPASPVRLPVGSGPVGWVAVEGKPLSSSSEGAALFAGFSSPAFPWKVESFAAVPVRGARRTVAVLEVANRAGGRAFDAADLNLLSVLAREGGLALDHRQQALEDQRTIMDLLRGISRFLDAKAPYLAGHSERVAKISQTLAEELGLSPEEAHQAYLAGLLHDLGNVGVDDELFLSARALTPDETEKMKQHTSMGAEILREVAALRHLMNGPLYHHERFDGRGYPEGLAGEGIPILARIVGVAEAFDAVRSARPYRPAKPLPEALAHVRAGEGVMFDPKVVAALLGAYQRGRLPG